MSNITAVQEIKQDKDKLENDIADLVSKFINIHPCKLDVSLSYYTGNIKNNISLTNVKIDLTI